MADAEHHEEHHGGMGTYMAVFFGLCILTTFSFLTYFDFWRENISVEMSRLFMMAVSCTKAMLVIMFFMHLKWEASWKWVLTVPASIMSALLVFALVPDIYFRMDYASNERMKYAAERPAEVTEASDTHTDGADHGEGGH
ncbi:MAG: cytochrome C oxidase subunit IV family protein [Planctomycetota bacterium]